MAAGVEEPVHTVSAVRKQRPTEACSELASSFSQSLRSQPVWMVPVTFGPDLPISVNLI